LCCKVWQNEVGFSRNPTIALNGPVSWRHVPLYHSLLYHSLPGSHDAALPKEHCASQRAGGTNARSNPPMGMLHQRSFQPQWGCCTNVRSNPNGGVAPTFVPTLSEDVANCGTLQLSAGLTAGLQPGVLTRGSEGLVECPSHDPSLSMQCSQTPNFPPYSNGFNTTPQPPTLTLTTA
jgi:hypothetical protein